LFGDDNVRAGKFVAGTVWVGDTDNSGVEDQGMG
jgi:hypothetical protein